MDDRGPGSGRGRGEAPGAGGYEGPHSNLLLHGIGTGHGWGQGGGHSEGSSLGHTFFLTPVKDVLCVHMWREVWCLS